MALFVKKFYPDATLPTRATIHSAGLDLYVYSPNHRIVLYPNKVTLVSTGIGIQLGAPDKVGLVYPRSSIALYHQICCANGVGVIDSDYTGEIKVPLINLGRVPYVLPHNQRFAQLTVSTISLVTPIEVTEFPPSQRGEKGFGSTGK